MNRLRKAGGNDTSSSYYHSGNNSMNLQTLIGKSSRGSSKKGIIKRNVKLYQVFVMLASILAGFSLHSLFKLLGRNHSSPTTERIKKITNERAIFAALGNPLPISEEEFQLRQNNTKIHIVVSHCEEHVDWIANYIGDGFHVKKITIISKCGRKVRGLDKLSQLTHVQLILSNNVGRCDHSYAKWIQQNYIEIQENVDTDGDDLVLFMKDNKRFRRLYYNFRNFFTYVTDAGFGCIKKPECDCNAKCNRWRLKPLVSHNKSYVLGFSLDEYKRVNRDDNHEFLNLKYPDLNSWKIDMNLVLPQSSPTIPVCYGGMFGVQKRLILNQPLSVWTNIMKSLERGDNIIEGHYAERMWAGMLSSHNEFDSLAEHEILAPEIWDMVRRPTDGHVCGMQGMYYMRRTTNYTYHIQKLIKNYSTTLE